MKLTLRNPRTWVVIVLSLLLVIAFASPFGGGPLSVTEAAPQTSVAPTPESEPFKGLGDRTGVQDVVSYTVRDASGKVIEQGTTGQE